MHFTQQALRQHIPGDALLIHFYSYSAGSMHNTTSSFYLFTYSCS